MGCFQVWIYYWDAGCSVYVIPEIMWKIDVQKQQIVNFLN
jgi:hypothetical protein